MEELKLSLIHIWFQGYNYLNYLYFDGDLMSYNTRTGDKIQQIDEIVLGVLRTIGWEEPESNLRIIAEGIDDTGIASSSQSYNFHAETTSGSIANYSWKYELLDNEMNFVTIKTGDSVSYTHLLLRRNLLIYGLGGVIVPFIGIKLIDLVVSLFF